MLDYYIIRIILYFPRIVIYIFIGLYSLAYIRPHLVLVIYSLLYTKTQVFLQYSSITFPTIEVDIFIIIYSNFTVYRYITKF